MAMVIEIPCPGCKRVLKVPESVFGKTIKCKHCGEKIEVERGGRDDLDDSPKSKKPQVSKPSKPSGAVKAKPKEEEKPKPQPAQPSTYQFVDPDEDDEGGPGVAPKPLTTVDEGADVPRCPHCAQELDPPDAIVCVHCGFNNVTRVKAESKKTWAPAFEDWVNHLGPGILALAACIGLITVCFVVYFNIEDWLADTFLEDEPAKDGKKAKFFGRAHDACTMFTIVLSLLPAVKLGRFAFKRLVLEYQPEEKVKV